MRTRKSILSGVIYLNLSIAVIIAILFFVSSAVYSHQLSKERYHLASTKLTRLNSDFQLEMNRLDALFSLCIRDSSLVYTLTDKLGKDFFEKNAEDASSKLSLLRQSLPYAKTVFLYTKSSKRVVQDNGHLYTENDFVHIVLNKNDNNKLSTIKDLPDGLYHYSNFYALYVKNLYKHGYIAASIYLPEFANIHKSIDSDFLGYVVDEDGKSLISNPRLFLSDKDIKLALENDFINCNNTKYYSIASKMSIFPYIGLVLVNNDELMSPLYYMYTVMGITFVILLASSLLLVFLNYKLYLPLKKFTSQFGSSGDNEVAILENQIHELLYEINCLSSDTNNSGMINERIALYYLLSTTSEPDEKTLAILEEKYPYYMVIVLVIQNNSGNEDISFVSALEKKLVDRFELKFINVNKYTYSLIAKPEDKEEILKEIEAQTADSNNDIQVFAGIREYCTAISGLNAEYKLAENSLLASPVINGKKFTYSTDNNLPNKKSRLPVDIHNLLFEYARNNAPEMILKELELIFYPEAPISISDFRHYYVEIQSIFEKACLVKKLELPTFTDGHEAYNTNFMYQNLSDLSYKLFAKADKEQYDITNRMEEYISSHLSEPLTLSSVAEAFSITPVYLSSWFKKNMGTNFSTYVSTIKMDYAIKLLCQQNPPKIQDIASSVGIDSTATFIRQFKKHTGTTPSQYQKSWASSDNKR